MQRHMKFVLITWYLGMIKLAIVRIIIFAALISAVTAPSYAVTGKKPDARAAKRGAVLYRQHCISCHGDRGIGGATVPPLIRQPDYYRAPALNDSEHAWHHSDENLTKTILDGSPRTSRMPAWKHTLKKTDARDLVDYIKSLWGQRALDCQGPKHMSCM